MKADLDLKLIKSLTLDQVPQEYDSKEKIEFAANPKRHANGKPNAEYVSSYILWDSNRAAPPGFGVRVVTKKTYVIRRKVHGKSIMPTVGNVADFNKLDEAREKAADLARTMVQTGKNPNELARKSSADELTLGQAMAKYREYLVTRTQRPAKPETLKAFDRAVRKHEAWGRANKKVRDIETSTIETKFKEGEAFPTANERAFRWAMAAAHWCIDFEALTASAERREPTRSMCSLRAMRVNYLSLSSDAKRRDIVPVALADNGQRWHARGYDRERKRFGDFVLTWIVKAQEIENEVADHEALQADEQWA